MGMGIEVKNPFRSPDLGGTIRVLHHHTSPTARCRPGASSSTAARQRLKSAAGITRLKRL
jgi:hypothetical protein